MGDLKPIGSEKLTGQDKIKRIMEIARFNEVIPEKINETAKKEYSVNLADGHDYQIVREKQGYVIKRTISESDTDFETSDEGTENDSEEVEEIQT